METVKGIWLLTIHPFILLSVIIPPMVLVEMLCSPRPFTLKMLAVVAGMQVVVVLAAKLSNFWMDGDSGVALLS